MKFYHFGSKCPWLKIAFSWYIKIEIERKFHRCKNAFETCDKYDRNMWRWCSVSIESQHSFRLFINVVSNLLLTFFGHRNINFRIYFSRLLKCSFQAKVAFSLIVCWDKLYAHKHYKAYHLPMPCQCGFCECCCWYI